MSGELMILCITAITIGFLHTLFGPDHYVPFIVLSKARKWSGAKTAFITFLCGLGHVLSSVVLGLIGLSFGIAVFRLEMIEGWRGNVAAWLLMIFGFAYMVWSIHNLVRNKRHEHGHLHGNGDYHVHEHGHAAEHAHVHESESQSMTPWVLFLIFVFGPCEPLIPLLMYPAAKGSLFSAAVVASVFSVVTIGTMMSLVLVSFYGLSFLKGARIERYTSVFAGLTVFLCGAAINFLGL